MDFKLVIPPNKAGYAVVDGTGVVSTAVDGGPSRFRADVIGQVSRVNVAWSLNPEKYRYVRQFYHGATRDGAEGFLIDLVLDDPVLTEHRVHFVPDSMRLAGTAGHTYEVTAQLEVEPVQVDYEYDALMAALYQDHGPDHCEYFNVLEQLANVELPYANPPAYSTDPNYGVVVGALYAVHSGDSSAFVNQLQTLANVELPYAVYSNYSTDPQYSYTVSELYASHAGNSSVFLNVLQQLSNVELPN